MRKIPTLFRRDDNDRRYVTREVHPDCQWVIDGAGTSTRKVDGTCVMLDSEGRWYARREVKPGKAAPPHFFAVETDTTTGKTVGWEPVEQSAFAKYHAEAVANEEREVALAADDPATFDPGTYELVGPKVNGNPEGVDRHLLWAHGDALDDAPRDFDGLAKYLADFAGEGIVWHYPQPDGTVLMAKLKKRDFPKAGA
jgi:hypothetical protein